MLLPTPAPAARAAPRPRAERRAIRDLPSACQPPFRSESAACVTLARGLRIGAGAATVVGLMRSRKGKVEEGGRGNDTAGHDYDALLAACSRTPRSSEPGWQ